MVKRLAVAISIIAAVAPLAAQAPVPSAPVLVAQQSIPIEKPDKLDDWAKLFVSGQWGDLQSDVRKTLDSSQFGRAVGSNPTALIHKFNFRENYYRIMFLSTFRRPEGELFQFLVYDPSLPPFSNRLPGVKQLFDVFLTTVPDASLKTSYLSTQQSNPLLEKIPAFFKMIDLAQLAKLDFLQLHPNAAPATLFIHISRVNLPFDRASIAISDEASQTAPLDSGKLITNSAALRDDLSLRTARGSRCATLVASCLDEAIQDELGSGAGVICSLPRLTAAEVAECAQAPIQPVRLQCQIVKRMKHAYDEVVGKAADCPPGTGQDFRPVVEVEEAFKNLVAASAKTVQAKKDATYENVPLEHVSLGALATVMLATSGDTRIKMDSGKLVSDPLTGTLAAAVVNYHPRAFDPKSLEITPGERFRLFGGVAVSPEFGLVAGIGYSLWRGVSMNLGVGALRVNTFKRGDTLDPMSNTPKNPKDPFRDGFAGVAFFGFGYNF